jgi:hypothetical protein
MVRQRITMYRDGRMTVPVNARKALHLDGEAEFTYEIVGDGLLLHPVVSIPREDAWAYTPEHRASVERALASPDIPGVTEADLEAINAADDPAAAARDLIARRLRA